MYTPPPSNYLIYVCAFAMPRAKKKSAKGSNFKEDDSALVLMCYYSMPLGVSMYILAPVNADLYIE